MHQTFNGRGQLWMTVGAVVMVVAVALVVVVVVVARCIIAIAVAVDSRTVRRFLLCHTFCGCGCSCHHRTRVVVILIIICNHHVHHVGRSFACTHTTSRNTVCSFDVLCFPSLLYARCFFFHYCIATPVIYHTVTLYVGFLKNHHPPRANQYFFSKMMMKKIHIFTIHTHQYHTAQTVFAT